MLYDNNKYNTWKGQKRKEKEERERKQHLDCFRFESVIAPISKDQYYITKKFVSCGDEYVASPCILLLEGVGVCLTLGRIEEVVKKVVLVTPSKGT